MVQLVDGNLMPSPCGKCPPCIKRRVSQWSFRLQASEKHAETAYFVTLTYDTDNVPITKNGFMTLNQRDVQLFFKKLRKGHIGKPIKYYYCGEYGGNKKRPHYHVILLNSTPEAIEKAWTHGKPHFGAVNGASIGYTLKYLHKGKTVPMHANDDRFPEFSRMSKRVGLEYLTDDMKKWHHADLVNRGYVPLPGDIKCAMPRYYKNKLYSDDQKEEIMVNAQLADRTDLTEEQHRNIIQGRLAAYRNFRKQAETGRNKI